MEVKRVELDAWKDLLPDTGFDVFHTAEALSVLDDHVESELHLFGGFKGQEPVGLLPMFVRTNPVGVAAFSPPPSMAVPHLGPVLMPTSPKRRKIERVNKNFARGVIDELDAESRRTLFRLVGGPAYTDPRPFSWADMDVQTRFTYVLDASVGRDALLGQFSSDLRSDIRSSEELDLTVSVEATEVAVRIARDVADRYREQDQTPPFTIDYVRDLVEALGERARTYVARDADGDYLGGLIVLYSNDRANFWQGGVRRDYDGVSVNSLLHWRVIRDVMRGSPFESVERYDLVGANTERLCDYKSKFGADLVPYYVVESEGRGMAVAKRAYQTLKG